MKRGRERERDLLLRFHRGHAGHLLMTLDPTVGDSVWDEKRPSCCSTGGERQVLVDERL